MSKTKLYLVGTEKSPQTGAWIAITNCEDEVSRLMDEVAAEHGSARYKSFYLEDKVRRKGVQK
jgi:hypothetical protein